MSKQCTLPGNWENSFVSFVYFFSFIINLAFLMGIVRYSLYSGTNSTKLYGKQCICCYYDLQFLMIAIVKFILISSKSIRYRLMSLIQERNQEKVVRQYQADIRHLQTQLKQEKETVLDLQKTMHKQQIENEKSTSKRKKSMFKPNSNFLGTPLT